MALVAGGVLLFLSGCQPSVEEQVDSLYQGERSGSLDLVELEEALGNESAHVRVTAAALLGRLGDPRGVSLLTRAAADEDRGVRATVASSLGRLAGPDALMPLLELASDESELVRLKAIQSLGKVSDERALDTLFLALDEEIDSDLREAAVEALAEIASPDSLAGLIVVLQDEQPIVRAWAARALGEIGDAAALPALEAMLESESAFDRGAAEQALGRIRAGNN